MTDWPHNTQILRDNGYYAGAWGDPLKAMKRGRELHAAVHLLNAGFELNNAWVLRHPNYEGYIAGAQKFRAEHQVHLLKEEFSIRCEQERYVTTLDEIVEIDDTPFAILEIKTGSRPNSIELQTGGQKRALRLENPSWIEKPWTVKRLMLLLPGDGTYKLEEFTDPRDEEEFVLLCRAWWVNAKRGIHG